MARRGVLVSLVIYLMFPANIIGLWWAVGSPLLMDPNTICRKSRKLGGKQSEICRKEPEIVREVVLGAKRAIAECQYQFRDRRWNCSTASKGFGRILRRDTRETAFVNAVSSAGVVFHITQACSMGLLLQCTCDNSKRKTTNGSFEWGGCGDNVKYGYKKSKEFMDAVPKRKRGDIRTMILLHNNEAGRLAVKNYMRRECKCHGLSGTCSLKTCWTRMPYFRTVGKRLKDKFDSATEVIGSNDGSKLMPEDRGMKPAGEEDLIYTEKSPNFCKRNKRHGSLGTRGRECDPTSSGVGGCELLCCGRGYKKYQVKVKENCKCRFNWCCKVTCQTCVHDRIIYKCS